MGDECVNPGDFFPPAKRFRPVQETASSQSSASPAKLNFAFTPNSVPQVQKIVKVQEIPLFRVQSTSSDVSMGAEEMDVDI